MFGEAKKLQLKKEDQARVREKLYAFMNQNPAPLHTPITILLRQYAVALSILVFILGTTGVSLAAEQSLPGNVLYPLKQFNEGIVSSFMLSDAAKLQWEIRLVERRLEEAERLAAEEDPRTSWTRFLEEDFEKRAQEINIKIAELELNNKMAEAAEFSSNFETSLRAHNQIITRIIKTRSEPENDFEPLALNIRAKTNMAERARIKTEDIILSEAPEAILDGVQLSITPTPTTLDTAIREKMDDIFERIKKAEETIQNPSLSEASMVEILKRLTWAEELIEKGKKQLGNGSISKSFLFVQQAERVVKEIEVLIGSHLNLYRQINIQEGTISIKDCVYPILESFPRQCKTPEGNLVIEEDLEIEIR